MTQSSQIWNSSDQTHLLQQQQQQQQQQACALTRVLLSSIFFMADSVVRGHLSTAYWSSFSRPTALQQEVHKDSSKAGRQAGTLHCKHYCRTQLHQMPTLALPKVVTAAMHT
jgi:hypothetical protein